MISKLPVSRLAVAGDPQERTDRELLFCFDFQGSPGFLF
jgi:hypothetical protein